MKKIELFKWYNFGTKHLSRLGKSSKKIEFGFVFTRSTVKFRGPSPLVAIGLTGTAFYAEDIKRRGWNFRWLYGDETYEKLSREPELTPQHRRSLFKFIFKNKELLKRA
jgi:hypothetical protein